MEKILQTAFENYSNRVGKMSIGSDCEKCGCENGMINDKILIDKWKFVENKGNLRYTFRVYKLENT